MRNVFCLLFSLMHLSVAAQSAYWQQSLRYTIRAELNDAERTITAHESIVYKNNSPDTLGFIWFHLWPNAYLHDSTAMMVQLRKDLKRRKLRISNSGTGYITGLSFQVNGAPAMTEPHPNPQYVDVVKLLLEKPLPPGDSVTISTPFHVKLPPYFSRSGYSKGQFMICQWYPKPAVYDERGWHAFPYLDRGEFYSEYGDFNVSITVPARYVVGATGVLLSTTESEEYKSIGKKNTSTLTKKWITYVPPDSYGETKTLEYRAVNVHDFAWFADPGFVIQYDTIQLDGGRVVEAFSYFHNKRNTTWKNSIAFARDAVKKYSKWIGAYEYPVVQIVEGPGNNLSGGMEYPMITLITKPRASPAELDGVITHEIGHNWFMSMLGSNERMHAWMDEGLDTYYQFRYEAIKYRTNSVFRRSLPSDVEELSVKDFQDAVYQTISSNIPMRSAMDVPAADFPDKTEYGLVSYVKTALWLYQLETMVGPEEVDKAVQYYFERWKHKHPYPRDMQDAFEEALKRDLDSFFALTKKKGKF